MLDEYTNKYLIKLIIILICIKKKEELLKAPPNLTI